MEKLEFDFVPGKNCTAWAFVGSRVTCNPAPTDTDRDVLVLCVEGEVDEVVSNICDAGGECCSAVDYGDSMTAVRLNNDNYIITDKREYFDKFIVMTQLAKNWNIQTKQQRHELFQAAVDGREPWCLPSDRIAVNETPIAPVGSPF